MEEELVPEQQRFRKLRVAGGVLAVLFGLGLILVVSAVGHCSAFGGTCPSDPPPLWDDDVFGTTFIGAFIASAVPTWLATVTSSSVVSV